MPTVNLNTRAAIPVEFTDTSGAFVDPGTVRLKVQRPSQAITTYTHPNAQITKSGTGQYTTTILFNVPGKWVIFWQGSSSNEVTEETTVIVNGSPFYDADGDEIADS